MEKSKSPIVQTKETKPLPTMKFPAAMQQVIEGKKVFRLEWEDKNFYGFLNKDTLSLHKPDGKNYQWIISEGDLLSEDWLVI